MELTGVTNQSLSITRAGAGVCVNTINSWSVTIFLSTTYTCKKYTRISFRSTPLIALIKLPPSVRASFHVQCRHFIKGRPYMLLRVQYTSRSLIGAVLIFSGHLAKGSSTLAKMPLNPKIIATELIARWLLIIVGVGEEREKLASNGDMIRWCASGKTKSMQNLFLFFNFGCPKCLINYNRPFVVRTCARALIFLSFASLCDAYCACCWLVIRGMFCRLHRSWTTTYSTSIPIYLSFN